MTMQFALPFAPTRLPGSGVDGAIVFWDDFLTLPDTTNDWVLTDESGTATTAAADEAGGALILSTSAAAGADASLQLQGDVFAMNSGQRLSFVTRVKVDVLTVDVLVGLAATDATPFATDPASFAGFTLDGDANIQTLVDTTGASGSRVDSGVDIVADTYVDLAIEWTGSALEFYIDGTMVRRVQGTDSTVPKDTALNIILGIETSAGTTDDLTVAHVGVIMERPA